MFRTLLIGGLGLLPLNTAQAAPSAARGEYLVSGPAACGNCHTPLGSEGPDMAKALGARLVEENPAFTAYAPNMTPGGRVADWTDDELVRAIREGVRPDGSVIGPPMPFALYRGLSDDDVRAIVAYLRTIPPVEGQQPASVYHIPCRRLTVRRSRPFPIPPRGLRPNTAPIWQVRSRTAWNVIRRTARRGRYWTHSQALEGSSFTGHGACRSRPT